MATTAVLPSQSGMSLSIEDDLDARVDGLLQLVLDVRAGRGDGDRLDALGDHRLDRGDLALVVGAALALGEDDLGVRVVLRPTSLAASTMVS